LRRLLKVTLLLALAVGLFGAYRYVAAQESQLGLDRVRINLPTFDPQTSVEPDSVDMNHVLERTYIANGNMGTFIAASTNVQIGPQVTVVCPGATGTCTIQADMWVQNGGGIDKKENQNDICLEVDGALSSGCPYTTGETPIDGGFVQSSSSQSISGIATGDHTVQTYFSTYYGAQVNYYNSTYRVYKP
jgi:hypothetical protein